MKIRDLPKIYKQIEVNNKPIYYISYISEKNIKKKIALTLASDYKYAVI